MDKDEAVSAGLKTEIVDPTTDGEWDRQVLSHANANAFHSSTWCRVLRDTYGHRPKYLRLSRGGELAALVPLIELRSLIRRRRAIALPFSDFCDALIYMPGYGSLVFGEIVRLAKLHKWGYVELRGGEVIPKEAKPAVSFHAHKLDLKPGIEKVFASFRSSVRQALRRGEQSDLQLEKSDSEGAMRIFYKLHSLTRQRHGLPPQSFSFFLNIHEQIIRRGMGFINIVRYKAEPIAAMVFFQWGKTGIYKFGASNKAFQRFRPNNLAMAGGIRSLQEAGCSTLHFGRSSLGNEGLRRFKLTWGAKEETLQYYRYFPDSGEWGRTHDRTEGFHTEVFRRLPASINRMVGALLYSQLD